MGTMPVASGPAQHNGPSNYQSSGSSAFNEVTVVAAATATATATARVVAMQERQDIMNSRNNMNSITSSGMSSMNSHSMNPQYGQVCWS